MSYLPAVPDEGRTVRRYPLTASQTPLEGAPVLLAAGAVSICAVPNVSCLGFMACDYFDVLEIDPYNGDAMVYVAKPGSTFWLSGSTDPTDLSSIGIIYGMLVEATTQIAYVDLTDTTTNLVVQVEDVDLMRLLFKVSILEAVRQLHA